MPLDQNDTATWTIYFVHVPASDLGTSIPWIPPTTEIKGAYYTVRAMTNGPDFVEFKNAEHEVLFAVPAYSVRKIVREGADVRELDGTVEDPAGAVKQ